MINVRFGGGAPLFDIAAYARRGPGRRDRLSPAEVALIARTARRAPEVMVKVASGGSTTLASVARHVDYITHSGKLALQTDEDEQAQEPQAPAALMERWNLDLDVHRRRANFSASEGCTPAKLVHKLILSMPAGTPPQGVAKAAAHFLRDEFASKHRYAFALHTDTPHPHVHVVVKAASEQRGRLLIDKETLRRWRAAFAMHLRAVGIDANATERAVRGQSRRSMRAATFRATRRGESSHMRRRVEEVIKELSQGRLVAEPGSHRLSRTRGEVEAGWLAVERQLIDEGRGALAADVHRFVERMVPARTDKQWLAHEVLRRAQAVRAKEQVLTR